MNETIITDGLGSVRTEAAPRRTITAYKLMRLVDGKLYPLYIDRSEPVQLGVWYNADSVSKTTLESLDFGYHLIDLRSEQVIESRQRKPSLDQVKRATAHNWRWFYVVQQKTKIGYKNVGIAESNGEETVKADFALRPGWHCGSLPVMNQIGKGPNRNLRDDSFVWTEIEISADIDYNDEAKANGGELYYIPHSGYYEKCTNANKTAAQADKMSWYIAGAIRINRIISDSEARQIIDRYNRQHRTNIKYDYPRESGKMFNADTMSLEGLDGRRYYGGNSGYQGYSKSNRAVDAEKRGLRSKSQMDNDFADKVNELIKAENPAAKKVTLAQIKKHLDNITADEWHHTSKFGNRTNYYSVERVATHFIDNIKIANATPISFVAKEDIDKILDYLQDSTCNDGKGRYLASNGVVVDVHRGEPPFSRAYNEGSVETRYIYRYVEPYELDEPQRSMLVDALAEANNRRKMIVEAERTKSLFNESAAYERVRAAIVGAGLGNTNDYDSINAVFNERLQQQINGFLPKKYIYELGMPSPALLYAGVENLPIEMAASTLITKSDTEYIHYHPFNLSEIMNLPLAIQKPVAVFEPEVPSDTRRVILTEITQGGNNFVAVLEMIRLKGRNANIINSVISLYAKESAGRIAKWFDSKNPNGLKLDHDLCKWADIKKAFKWLTNHATDVRAVGMSTKRIANIINSFKDYQFFDENYQEKDKTDQSAPLSGTNDNDNFKRWFSGSKVVDADGKPLVVYHGTTKDFTTFSKEKIGKANNGRYGFFFTPDESLATDFTRRRWQNPESQPKKNAHNIAVYLNLRNPLIVTAYQYVMNAVDNMDLSKYDGIIITPFSKEEKARWDSIWGKNSGSKEFDHNQYVVFSPNQIKSATRNNGHFSPESDNILEGVSGTDEPQPKQSHYGLLFDETDAKWNLTAEDIALIDELQKEYSEQITANEPERNRRNAQLAYCLIKFLNGESDAVTKNLSSSWYLTNRAYINPEYARYEYIADYLYHNPITRNIVRKYVPDLKGMSGSIKKMFEFLIELYKQRKADTAQPTAEPEPTADEPQNASDTYRFAEKLAKLYADGEKFDWAKAKKMAEAFKIGSEQELMQACELAVVLSARRIAHNGQSIAQRFAALKDLYDQQVTVRPLDTQSKILQQYSTPCPLAFLLGEFVLPKNYNGQWGYFLEPSAGNGMLTIALPESRTVVNEIDDIRRKNLEAQGFLNVLNHDASAEVPSADAFIGVITNPPFGKLPDKEKIERRGWAINTLDYKMAVVALDRMDKDGRAAIIVGGKMWNSYWKPLSERSQKKVLFGQWKTFLGYLYAQYNVVDVVYINGDNIYRKQGTQYPIVAILIDGRHDYNEAVKPNYVFDPDRDVIIDTYDQLFDRLMPHLQPGEAADNDEIDASKIHFDPDGKTENADVDKIEKMAKELYYGDRLRLARAKAKALLLYTYAQSNTLRGKDTPKRGDVYTLPKSWARHDAWLSNDEKDAYDFYSVANVSGDKVSVINESLMVTSVYTLENFKKMGFKFHHHEDKYGTIGGVDGVDDECIERIENLHKAADTINKWVVQNKNGTFNIKLPQFVENEITQAIGRAVDVHKIDSKGIRHSIKNHGIKGKKVEPTDIPVRDEYYMLIPYIMVSPDFVEKGSADIVDRESVRFVKRLSNGDLIVVEKESLNDPNVFETVNMWGKLSDVVNVPKNPNIHVRNVPISTSDIAKIIQDAEMAIIKDKIK